MKIITRTTIETTWAELKAAADAGTIDEIVKSGDLIPFTLKNGEEVVVRAAHDKNGKLFFIFEDCLKDGRAMNETIVAKGGWAACKMRKYLDETVFPLLPDELQSVIAPTKIVQVVNGERVETEDKLFLLSRTQVFGKGYWSDWEPEDAQLNCFLRRKDRIKEQDENHHPWVWWLRSVTNYSYFTSVNGNGNYNTYYATCSYGVELGFCLN